MAERPEPCEEPEEKESPPFFRTWRSAYLVVIGTLVVLIGAFYLFTKAFE